MSDMVEPGRWPPNLTGCLGRAPRGHVDDAAPLVGHAHVMDPHRRADPLELGRVEAHPLVPQVLLQHEPADPHADGQPVGFGLVVEVVGGDATTGSWAVLDNDRGVARYVPGHVPRQESRVGVETAAGRGRHHDVDGLAGIEIVGCGIGRHRGQGQGR